MEQPQTSPTTTLKVVVEGVHHAKYTHHKPTDQARVRIDGKDHYLGKYGSQESRDAYDRLILRWRQRNDLSGKHSTTVGQLCLAFIEHADQFYRDTEGYPTGEANNFRKALRPPVELFRALPCSEFGPLKLKQVQEELTQKHVRSQVNKNISRIKSVFRWGGGP